MRGIANRQRCVLFFLHFLLLCFYPGICCGEEKGSSEDSDLVTFLLDKVQENYAKVNNFTCLVRYNEPDIQIGPIGADLPQGPVGSRQRIEKIAIATEGRGRLERTIQTENPDGGQTETREQSITTWDGTTCIEFRQEQHSSPFPYSARLSNEAPLVFSKRYSQPWTQFGGRLRDEYALARTLDKEVSATKEQDKYYLRFTREYDEPYLKTITTYVIDPNQGFSVVSKEDRGNGILLTGYKARFKEVCLGIWFPVEAEVTSWSPVSDDYVRTTISVSGIRVNDPNFYTDLYQVDFPDGTHVYDKRTDVTYTVGQPLSLRTDADPNSPTVGSLMWKELYELATALDKAPAAGSVSAIWPLCCDIRISVIGLQGCVKFST